MPRKQVPHVPGKCNKCGAPSGKFKLCPICRENNRIALAKFYGRPVSSANVCQGEGCKEEIPTRATFCRACAKSRKLKRDREYKAANAPGAQAFKPHRPAPVPERKPLISEEEQQRLDAEASRRDREWNRRFFKETMGIESPAPGLPMASKVVTPPKEVWEQYQRDWKPQRETESGSMVLPYLMRDLTF